MQHSMDTNSHSGLSGSSGGSSGTEDIIKKGEPLAHNSKNFKENGNGKTDSLYSIGESNHGVPRYTAISRRLPIG